MGHFSSLDFWNQNTVCYIRAQCCHLQSYWHSKSHRLCKKGTAANWRRSGLEGHRFETRCLQRLFAVKYFLKCTLLLWFVFTISSHGFNVLFDCTFACEICDMSSMNKRSGNDSLKVAGHHWNRNLDGPWQLHGNGLFWMKKGISKMAKEDF